MSMPKSGIIGIVLLIAGVTCGGLERVFYGNRLNESNVLQESFFLPLSIFLTFIGIAILVFAGAQFCWRKCRKPKRTL
jgi:hypothetical protein